jgi:hypothetical protein
MHGMTFEDVHAEAFPAVLEAAKRFDHRRSNKFSTYAYPFILGRIYRAVKRNDALNHSQYELDERTLPQGAGTWKMAGRQRISIPGGSKTPVWTFDRWRLLELNPRNNGRDKYSDQGKFLRSLGVDTLNEIREWLEENKERAIAVWVGGSSFGTPLVQKRGESNYQATCDTQTSSQISLKTRCRCRYAPWRLGPTARSGTWIGPSAPRSCGRQDFLAAA